MNILVSLRLKEGVIIAVFVNILRIILNFFRLNLPPGWHKLIINKTGPRSEFTLCSHYMVYGKNNSYLV